MSCLDLMVTEWCYGVGRLKVRYNYYVGLSSLLLLFIASLLLALLGPVSIPFPSMR